MSAPTKTERPMTDAQIVEAYLTASMIPDPDAASAYMKPGTVITFTGGREFDHPRGPTGFNAKRYRWVKKQMDRFDVCLLPSAEHPVMRSSFPLKFFEYLLRERPVVSKPLPALEPFRDWYHPANSAPEFVAAVEGALSGAPGRDAIRRETANRFGWDERARLLLQLRGELLDG